MTDRIREAIRLVENRYVITEKQGPLKASHIFQHFDGTYKVIDWGDRDNPTKFDSKRVVDDPKCLFILKCQLRPNCDEKLRPFFFFDKVGMDFIDEIEELRGQPKTYENLYWRGRAHLEREYTLDYLKDFLNDTHDRMVNQKGYFLEMARHKIALSLPGLGKACHREFEAFAVGTPALMPKFTNLYYENLIPDYHYISFEPSHHKRLAPDIIRRYHEVIRDDLFLSFIRSNAMRYYDEYIRCDRSAEWIVRLLEL